MKHIFVLFAMVIISAILVSGYPKFMKAIPNADKISNPLTGKRHPAVGHILENGTGARNCFGKDFDEAGYKWTKDLCRKDSDGDGISNGRELGDPNCTWSVEAPGHFDSLARPILSHPGVCIPGTSDICKIFNAPNSTCTAPGSSSADRQLVNTALFVCVPILFHTLITFL